MTAYTLHYSPIRQNFNPLFFSCILVLILCSCELTDTRKKYAIDIIQKVEVFKQEHQRLPDTVDEIGMEESEKSPAFYEKQTDTTFIVWYGKGLGESNVYHSDTKNWSH